MKTTQASTFWYRLHQASALDHMECLLANVGSTISLSSTTPHPQGYIYFNPLLSLPIGRRCYYPGASRLIKPTEISVTALDSTQGPSCWPNFSESIYHLYEEWSGGLKENVPRRQWHFRTCSFVGVDAIEVGFGSPVFSCTSIPPTMTVHCFLRCRTLGYIQPTYLRTALSHHDDNDLKLWKHKLPPQLNIFLF